MLGDRKRLWSQIVGLVLIRVLDVSSLEACTPLFQILQVNQMLNFKVRMP